MFPEIFGKVRIHFTFGSKSHAPWLRKVDMSDGLILPIALFIRGASFIVFHVIPITRKLVTIEAAQAT